MKKLLLSLTLFSASTLSVSALSDIASSDFREYITKAQQKNIISGYNDNTFRPNNPVSYIESLKIIINTGPQKSQIQRQPGKNWFTPFIDHYTNHHKSYLVSFDNNDAITRDFAVYLMLRQLDIKLDTSFTHLIPAKFPDIDNSTPFAPYILFAKYAGITDGYSDGTFGPKNKVSRGELTKMVWRSLKENKQAIQDKYNAFKTTKSQYITEQNTLLRQIEQKAKQWLTEHNGKYTNIDQVMSHVKNTYQPNTPEYKKIHEMLTNKTFDYKYKVSTQDTRTERERDWVKGGTEVLDHGDGGAQANRNIFSTINDRYGAAMGRGMSKQQLVDYFNRVTPSRSHTQLVIMFMEAKPDYKKKADSRKIEAFYKAVDFYVKNDLSASQSLPAEFTSHFTTLNDYIY